jgi:hypothetical protein
MGTVSFEVCPTLINKRIPKAEEIARKEVCIRVSINRVI